MTKIKVGNIFKHSIKTNAERKSSVHNSEKHLPEIKPKTNEELSEIDQAKEYEEFSPSNKKRKINGKPMFYYF